MPHAAAPPRMPEQAADPFSFPVSNPLSHQSRCGRVTDDQLIAYVGPILPQVIINVGEYRLFMSVVVRTIRCTGGLIAFILVSLVK